MPKRLKMDSTPPISDYLQLLSLLFFSTILLVHGVQLSGARGSLSLSPHSPTQAEAFRPLHFRAVPKDTVVNAGQRVQLECSADGSPLPQLSWQKDGGKDFPAARERRMLVSESGNTFYINEASVSDIGVYSCIAKNEIQTISSNASLVVYQPAYFSSPMSPSAHFLAGTTAILKCPAEGYPIPTIIWNKDGKPLPITERHFLTADDQLLIIVKSRFVDSGEYLCTIKNELSSDSGVTRLSIVPKLRHEPGQDSSVSSITPRTLSYVLLFCTFSSILFASYIIYSHFKKIPAIHQHKHEFTADDDDDYHHRHHHLKAKETEALKNSTAPSLDLLATSRGVTCPPSSTSSDTTSINQLPLDPLKDDYNPYGTVV